jgi:enamine deaminase RidA (YjgF/YER057c/UK114 family)
MDIHARLQSLNLTLPPAPKPVANYVPAVLAGDLLFVSGQLPLRDGQLVSQGPVPSRSSVSQAQLAARQCALNALAIVNDTIGGDWSRFLRVVHVRVLIASDNDFTEQPQVANGASDLFGDVLGEAGRHARAALGVNVLPRDATVEVELVVQVRGGE